MSRVGQIRNPIESGIVRSASPISNSYSIESSSLTFSVNLPLAKTV